MRITNKSRKHFRGTHKGAEINIDREPDGTFYIQGSVGNGEGGLMCDGWAPDTVRTMREARREAIAGAMLDAPKSAYEFET
jgi:predicted aspartyl protease